MHPLLKSLGNKPRKGNIFQCARCGTDFYQAPSRKKAKFCSRTCNNLTEIERGTSRELECSFCHKKFWRVPSQIKISINFCSQICTSKSKILTEEERVTPKSEVGLKGKKMPKGIWSTKYADRMFSEFIRKRDGKCVNCGRTTNLTCSHFWGRAHSSTRYDLENCDTLCWMPCHFTWEKQKQGEYRTMKLAQLGEKAYADLEKRANSMMKRSDAILAFQRFLSPSDMGEEGVAG